MCDCLQIVHLTGERYENDIIQKLQELNRQLSRGRKAKHLISSTICVSQNTEIPESVRYYGISMSTSGGISGQIMVAASCYSSWDSHVTDAVMTYYPNNLKKTYFDGTIRLPDKVRCQAFSLSDGKTKTPCRSCKDLFGLHTDATRIWPYGNCAEVESVSNLFENESEIKKKAGPTSDMCTDENRQQARISALNRLNGLLRDVGFTWDNKFFPNIEFDLKKRKLVTVTH